MPFCCFQSAGIALWLWHVRVPGHRWRCCRQHNPCLEVFWHVSLDHVGDVGPVFENIGIARDSMATIAQKRDVSGPPSTPASCTVRGGGHQL